MKSIAEQPMDRIRREATLRLDPTRRSALGQFLTPMAIARFMASLFTRFPAHTRLLDPGAGTGALSDAFAARFDSAAPRGASLEIEAYEIEPILLRYLSNQLCIIAKQGEAEGRGIRYSIHDQDFIAEATFALGFGEPRFTHVIMNPPYKKIGAGSDYRKLLRNLGIETVNLYTAFLGLAVAHVENQGEIVAIIPRSFCNGAYFRSFRQWLLKRIAFKHIHVFQSRSKAFQDDEVLQENIIVHLQRGGTQGAVRISTSQDASFSDYTEREIAFAEIVDPGDPESFIRIPTQTVIGTAALFSCNLEELGLAVSTGPVVDFRVREYWLKLPSGNCAPMLYAHHFKGGQFIWPKEHKKPNAVRLCEQTRKWLMPRGYYTVTKRFSAKEERRRLVAYVVDPELLPYEFYGFENHLNVFHSAKQGLDPELAHGLALFLNSTIADLYFRNFSGHTQVNATDLRSMRYPNPTLLMRLGKWARRQRELTQDAIDAKIEGKHGD